MTLSQLVSEHYCMKMITVIKLNEDITRVQNFIGITDELEQSEGVVDLITQIKALKEELALLHAQYDEQSAKLLVLRHAVVVSGKSLEGSSKVKILDLKPFGGARSAKELENFLWDMERYFSTARVVEMDKLNITTMYLTGDTKLWWRTRNANDESASQPKIDTW
ncbi:hypothetical protein T459_24609 [Capsicum annuum]|uniref:Retrotransposon gag domain-containing protein n=1 Tax=Capsicum annuum TaxID=4072 RepID=A0A2G2YIF8_CAPAN|nr:hypothetical protein T459_24609 [Capsicum annuum]